MRGDLRNFRTTAADQDDLRRIHDEMHCDVCGEFTTDELVDGLCPTCFEEWESEADE